MARHLGRTLAHPAPAAAAVVRLRPSRALATKIDFLEFDPSEESRMRRMERAIHGVLVRRAAPDWLPFVPGGSYWMPPMSRPLGVGDLLGETGGASVLTEEEAMCFKTVRGWPSAKYFVEGKFPHPVKRPRKDATQTDDEET